MKIKYIGETTASLTNGKVYEVLSVEHGWFRVIDDTEEDYLFSPDEFEVLSNL